jgi:alkylation response protein AidB-like acyl-CoA dehydrogenase
MYGPCGRYRRAHFNEVFLTDVPEPIANVVGEIDNGWAPARSVLAHGRNHRRRSTPAARASGARRARNTAVGRTTPRAPTPRAGGLP